MDDRLYFRQLLSGRDFARDDMVARQMVNFVYLIGDKETGEAVVIDPAYGIRDLLQIAEGDGMKLVGALATHYHPDHVGGSMGGYTIAGVRELLTLHPVPVHVQADEAPWVKRVTDASDSDLVEHASGDTLFLEGCGRMDLPGADPAAMYDSLTHKLAKIPDDAILFPGHQYSMDPFASMGETRQMNYVFRPKTAEQWLFTPA